MPKYSEKILIKSFDVEGINKNQNNKVFHSFIEWEKNYFF